MEIMAKNYLLPGVYIGEISKLPASIAEVETCIPAFIGYTEKAIDPAGADLHLKPKRIHSLVEYELNFGGVPPTILTRVDLDATNKATSVAAHTVYYMYDSIRLFYLNGGGDCFIVSTGLYHLNNGVRAEEDFLGGINAISKEDEPTLLLFPDAVLLGAPALGNVQKAALAQCAELADRFAILDLRKDDTLPAESGKSFKSNIGNQNLSYGAAYIPWLHISLHRRVVVADLVGKVFKNGVSFSLEKLIPGGFPALSVLLSDDGTGNVQLPPAIKSVIDAVSNCVTELPPSGAIAGVYARVDYSRGVWKSPANESLLYVTESTQTFSQAQLESLNIDPQTGKSINVIRFFNGKGTVVYGARTLAGNDNEWRYICVRRVCIMVEESCKKALARFTFEPNDAKTWTSIQQMTGNFLDILWRQGAFQGSKPEQAFYVAVGLGRTMTAADLQQKRLIVEIGLAVVKPAEFIILRIVQQMA